MKRTWNEHETNMEWTCNEHEMNRICNEHKRNMEWSRNKNLVVITLNTSKILFIFRPYQAH